MLGIAAGAIGNIGRYSFRLRPEPMTKTRNYLRKHAGDILDISNEILQLQQPSGDNNKAAAAAADDDDDKPESAANTAGLQPHRRHAAATEHWRRAGRDPQFRVGAMRVLYGGSGGVFLSTTTPATYLEEAAYKVVREALVNGIASEPVDGSAVGLDLCYAIETTKQLKVPKLTLVFDDDGHGGAMSTSTATMELRKSNYFLADSDTGLECLTIMPSRGGSVLGSLLQTDTNITFDIRGEQFVFETPPFHKLQLHGVGVSQSNGSISPIGGIWLLLF